MALLAIVIAIGAFAYTTCSKAVTAERHVRYAGIMNIASEKLAKTIRGMEMNAMNEFDEVEKHLDSPDAVIAALESKTDLNHEVRGYFAAFEPDYFPQKGKWFEPYVHHVDSNAFEVRQDFVIRDLERGKAGTIDMTVNGVPSTVYYGPIEHVDWSIAIVVAK